jgi:hypothetical protein
MRAVLGLHFYDRAGQSGTDEFGNMIGMHVVTGRRRAVAPGDAY